MIDSQVCFSCGCDFKKNADLQSENAKLKAEIDRLNNYVIKGHEQINDELKAELEGAENVIEFYADIENWSVADQKSFSYIKDKTFPVGDSDCTFENSVGGYKGGKRARSYLAERKKK